MTDPVTYAAAALLLACQLPNPPPIHCPADLHGCKQPENHITVRWVGQQPASAPHGATIAHADPHRLAIVRASGPRDMEDDPRPDPPRRHHHRHHHHRHHR